MAFLGIGGSASSSDTNYNKNYTIDSTKDYTQNTTNMPVLDPRWTGSFSTAQGNAGQFGYNPTQAQGIDYYSKFLTNPGVPGMYRAAQNPIEDTGRYQHAVTDTGNANLAGLSNEYAQINQNGLAPIFNNPAPKANLELAGGAPIINAQSGAGMSNPYSSLYGSAVTDPALAAFDYGTDRAFSALDARTAGGGGFANSRSGLAYSDLASQAALGRGQLSSQLNTQGLNSAFGFGQQDANRNLSASTTNAGNIQNNNQFNAGAANNMSQFNVNADQRNADQRLQASNQWAGNVGQRVGISNQVLANQMGMSQQSLNNVVNSLFTAQGFDAGAAQQLVSSGAITFNQLMQIVSASGAANGSTSNVLGNETANEKGQESGTSHTSGKSISASLGFSGK